MSSYPIHPAAELFPPVAGPELQALADDIKVRGPQRPVAILDDQVLDGRSRLAACEIAGVEPRFERLTAADVPDPIAYVVSANLHRRHLSPSQTAIIAAKAHEMMLSSRRNNETGANLRPVGRTSELVAEKFGVSRRTVEFAATVVRHGSPELIEHAVSGDISVSRAARIAQSAPKQLQAHEARLHIDRGPIRSAILTALADGEEHAVSDLGAAVRQTHSNLSDRDLSRQIANFARQPPRNHAVQYNASSVRMTATASEGETLYRETLSLLVELNQISRRAQERWFDAEGRRLQPLAQKLRQTIEATIGVAISEAAKTSAVPGWAPTLPKTNGLRRRILWRNDDEEKQE